MEKVFDNIKYILTLSKYMADLKENDTYLIEELSKLNKEKLKNYLNQYRNKEKINKIRFEIIKHIIENNLITLEDLEEIKNKVNNNYNTDILRSWKNFSIFYPLFIDNKKIKEKLENIAKYFLNVFKNKDNIEIKIQDFNGAQNFGDIGCWIAFYDKSKKSHQKAIQLFLNLYYNDFVVGIYDSPNEKRIKETKLDDYNFLDSIKTFIKENEDLIFHKKEKNYIQNTPLNQILYGPPGTGKTYNTIKKALEIIAQKEELDEEILEILKKDIISQKERKKLKNLFDEYRKKEQIEFITFHQSYGYEEFVEGIKPDVENEKVIYEVKSGVFKELSEKARENYENLSKFVDIENINFKDYLKVGQEFKTPTELKKFVISFVDNNSIKVINSNNKESSLSRKNIIELLQNIEPKGNISYERSIAKYIYEKINNQIPKNYILIIDEINRGNISKIFGELITLIEPSKRIGANEEIKITLPNSKEPFGVPQNLYIIGTMNTADRSIAQIDTALRRRFKFIEMMPDYNVLKIDNKDLIITDENNEQINIREMLKAINERIEYYYDREHQIGHSYFIPLKTTPTKEKLDEIFRNEIIPLLAEYFYDDWENIKKILNNDFIQEKTFTYIQNNNKKVYEINKDFTTEQYQKIYKVDE